MKKISLIISLSLIIVFVFSSLVAQPQSQKINSGLGFGVMVYNLYQNYFYDKNIPNIFLPYNINDKFRIEPEFSYFSHNYKSDSSDEYNETSVLRIGTGIFGKKNWNKFSLYYGIRLCYQKESTNGATTYLLLNDSSRFFWGPAVGGEYFLHPHFSLGCELGLRYTMINSDDNYINYYYNSDGIGVTKANMFLRFYL